MIYYVHKLNVSPRPCAKRESNEANASDMKSTPFISSGCIAVPPLPSLPQEDFIFHISLPLFDRSFTTFASNKVSKKSPRPSPALCRGFVVFEKVSRFPLQFAVRALERLKNVPQTWNGDALYKFRNAERQTQSVANCTNAEQIR